MALLWMDGFDHYDGNVENLNTPYITATNLQLTTTRSRNGAYSLRGANSSGLLTYALGDAKQTIGCGFALWIDSGGLTAPRNLVEIANAAGSFGASSHVTYYLTESAQIGAARGNYAGTNLVLSASNAFIFGAWNHLEFRTTISNTVGSIECRLNGVQLFSVSGIDTCGSGAENTPALRFSPGTVTSGNIQYMDDLFIWDTLGSQNNTFLGDRKVITLDLTENTTTAEWGYTGAASPVQAINGTNDGDSSYIIAGDSVPVTSDFEFENPDASVGQIAAVMSVIVARKEEAGTVIIQPAMVAGSSMSSDGNHSILDTYAYFKTIHPLNPETGVPWTPAALSSARLRLRRTT